LGYILYGLLQAIYFLPIVLRGRGINLGATSEKKQFKNSMRMVLLFLLVCITALLFRNIPAARSFTEVGYLFSRALQKPDLAEVLGITNGIYWILICSCFALEWINRKEEHGLSIERLNSPSRWFIYGAVMIVTFIFSEFSASGFIYAQF
jgi:amino acid permease